MLMDSHGSEIVFLNSCWSQWITIIIVVLVSKVDSYVGDSVNISWTAPFFPKAGTYTIYHTDKVNKSTRIIQVWGGHWGRAELERSKYEYVSRPYDSTNITFEIKDISANDAGHYYGGTRAESAWCSESSVLIVHSKYIYICGFRGGRDWVMVTATTPLNFESNERKCKEIKENIKKNSFVTWYLISFPWFYTFKVNKHFILISPLSPEPLTASRLVDI